MAAVWWCFLLALTSGIERAFQPKDGFAFDIPGSRLMATVWWYLLLTSVM
jgi:hypothetical protein